MNRSCEILLRIALHGAMLFSFIANGSSQVITDTLEEVNIRNKRKQQASQDERINNFSPGQKIKTIDSITLQQYQMQNMSSVLAQQTPVFIKSYGLNSLATLNFRGSSAAQSQVYWNGVPIQNAALGIADISLLPVSLVNKVHIVYGGSSALWGSGNVGGALLLETDQPVFDTLKRVRCAIAAGVGSYGQHQAGGKLDLGSKHWSFSTNVFVQEAENNFKYTDSYSQERETENSRLRGITILPQLGYKPDENNVLSITGSYQNYFREIPPALFELYSVKNREDESVRVLLDWSRKQKQGMIYARTAFLQDRMRYSDSVAMQFSNNSSYQYFLEAGIKRRIGERHQLLVFAPVQISWLKEVADIKQQNKYALAAAYTYSDQANRLQASLNLRSEIIDNNSILLPGLNASYRVFDILKLRANMQRTYRAPSLNELYYEPGGNKDLKPEEGWSEDIGYSAEGKLLNWVNILHDVSVFNRVIDDWILWLGGSIWTPHNIASVRSRGIETENLISFSMANINFHVGLNSSYVLATTLSSYIPNDGSIGKQIPYTPRYNGQINLGFSYKGAYFNYNHTYTGYRYVNVDESDLIPSYNTANIQVSYSLPLKGSSMLFTAQASNIFSASYEVVKARPMPGLNWGAGLRLIFN